MTKSGEYEPPFGNSGPQPEVELRAVHRRWADALYATPPVGIPLDKRGNVATFGNKREDGTYEHRADEGEGYCLQCGMCCYCVTLEGSLGSDWGACSNPKSEYDGRVVFEHWTCSHFRYVDHPDGDDRD